ncbi:MAG: hypothetical protein QHH10_11375, partial [Peptococcaceae bacterium]|nr:hypothetical protein [Peptococcaceae bacterium]
SGSVLKIFFDYALVLFSINCITPVYNMTNKKGECSESPQAISDIPWAIALKLPVFMFIVASGGAA